MKIINKVIENLQLLKKLEPLLENMDVEFIACIDWEDNWQCSWHTTRIVKSDTKNIETYDWWDMCQSGTDFYKTLTLKKSIEFLKQLWELKIILTNYRCNLYLLWNKLIKWENIHISTDTLLEAIEKMLEYLLDNNLLIK